MSSGSDVVERQAVAARFDVATLTRVFDALSDANRLRIVSLLAERERSGAELSEALGISAALTCHHLKTLEEAGIVERRREGQVKYTVLNPDVLARCFEQVLRETGRATRPG